MNRRLNFILQYDPLYLILNKLILFSEIDNIYYRAYFASNKFYALFELKESFSTYFTTYINRIENNKYDTKKANNLVLRKKVINRFFKIYSKNHLGLITDVSTKLQTS